MADNTPQRETYRQRRARRLAEAKAQSKAQLDAHWEKVTENADSLLMRITDWLAQEQQQTDYNWTDAGDVGYVVDHLKQIATFLFGDPE